MYDHNQNKTENRDCASRIQPSRQRLQSVDHILFNNILPTIDSTGLVDEHMYEQTLLGAEENSGIRLAQMYWQRELQKSLFKGYGA